jgi:hypothetical protein
MLDGLPLPLLTVRHGGGDKAKSSVHRRRLCCVSQSLRDGSARSRASIMVLEAAVVAEAGVAVAAAAV